MGNSTLNMAIGIPCSASTSMRIWLYSMVRLCDQLPTRHRLITIGLVLITFTWHTILHAKPLNIRNEGADTLVAVSSQSHPRLYITTADIRRLKERVKRPAYKKTWGRILDDARQYDNRKQRYRTRDGALLPEEKVLRRAAERLPQMALAFLVTGDEQYLTTATHRLDALAARHDWFGNDDMNAAYTAFNCIVAYDWLYDSLDTDQRNRYRDAVGEHVRHLLHLLQEKKIWWSRAMLQNHNYINSMAIGVAGIALAGEVPDANLWVEAAADNISRVMGYLSPDGASHEGVGYWSTGTGALLRYYLAVEPYRGINELRQSDFFRNTANFRLYMSLPGYIENADFADSPRLDYQGPGYILHVLARIFNDGHAQWLGDTIQSAREKEGGGYWLDLLWRDDEIVARPPIDLPVMPCSKILACSSRATPGIRGRPGPCSRQRRFRAGTLLTWATIQAPMSIRMLEISACGGRESGWSLMMATCGRNGHATIMSTCSTV